MAVVVLGVNHRSARRDVFERFAISGDRLPALLRDLHDCPGVEEAAVLATCNRTEIYLVASNKEDAHNQVVSKLSELSELAPQEVEQHLLAYHDDVAVRHLFAISSGLDSAIVGEHEILGQVRSAWDQARVAQTARTTLNLLFRHAVQVGKRARTETAISRHVTSVSQAAVILASQVNQQPAKPAAPLVRSGLATLQGKTALVVGAGSMARGVVGLLADAGISELIIANRTISNAEAILRDVRDLADAQTRAVTLDALHHHLGRADVVFAATNTDSYVVSRSMLTELDGTNPDRSPQVIVDLGMPRNVEPTVQEIAHVTLIDMEQITEFTQASVQARHGEVTAVQAIINDELTRFASLIAAEAASPMVRALRDHAEDIRRSELQRFSSQLNSLTDAQAAAVEEMTRSIVAKLMHEPTVQLKGAMGAGGDADIELVMRRLLHIEA